MFKKIGIVLICVALAATMFAGCSKKDANTTETTTGGGLEDSAQEFGFEEDEDGNTVAVEYEDGKAYVIDDQGNRTGEVIKNPKNNKSSNSKKKDETETTTTDGKVPTTQEDRTNVTNKTDGDETKKELTTLPFKDIKVPSTSESGKKVKFSDADITTVTNMLEVPYLYTASYENTDQVPISIATHAACWMLEREGLNTSTFASGTVVIDLFNYFDRTVVSFKTECNSYTGSGTTNPAPIQYNSSNDTFSITADSYEKATHQVNITEIQNLGNNNYYKVIGTVSAVNGSGCTAKKVEAVIQKNKLDSSLGFSVKALKWS